jgi:acyl-CoA synthetase (AMP-forming)/AMP-acid ligase II
MTLAANLAADAATDPAGRLNVTDRLGRAADREPHRLAVIDPRGKTASRPWRARRQLTFAELWDDTNRIAAGLLATGFVPGMRVVLLVPPSVEFVTLVFALLRAGLVVVLIDPGLGKTHLLPALCELDPDGFVAVPRAQAMRRLLQSRFPRAVHNVTVGPRWAAGATTTLESLRRRGGSGPPLPATAAGDPAAVIFTSGSTGPPKGVLYTHQHFDAQVEQLREQYGIEPGEIDLPGFPLFGLFNGAMGVTTVLPDMDASRPARVDPARIAAAVERFSVTQSFGSPAMWHRVGQYCSRRNLRLGSLRRVLSAGAPVPETVLRWMAEAIDPGGEIHTPYGATEALPVSTIASREVLGETARQTRCGAGVCVGTRFPSIQWCVIRVVDAPIPAIDQAEPLAAGQVGELIVRGPQVTGQYVTRTEWNMRSKIPDGHGFWHRMGDVGYLDDRDRFWFCGRASHRVRTRLGDMDTIPCEARFNSDARVSRTALVGIGSPGDQVPTLVVEPAAGQWPWWPGRLRRWQAELRELADRDPSTAAIRHFLFRRRLPVDIRHNAKIAREELAVWAADRISKAAADRS